MNDYTLSWAQIKKRPFVDRPHVVILGAGASLAAFPNGDRNGAALPLMNNLVDVLQLSEEIKRYNLECSDQDFEKIYSEIAANPAYNVLKNFIENKVFDYFSTLRLPDTPTIYDYLVLSLRKEDYIATFNWDPFLYLSCYRNHKIASLPTILYLHGNSIVGYCSEHRIQGLIYSACSVCNKTFTPTRLLYPVANKDYISDDYISSQWNSIHKAMENAFLVTIFGYSAPASDGAAIDLLSKAWGSPTQRHLEEIEFIDIKPEEELIETWSPFIHTHHYRVADDYFSSILGGFPRRSCEAMFSQLFEAKFLEYKAVPKFQSLDELHAWMKEISSHEKNRSEREI